MKFKIYYNTALFSAYIDPVTATAAPIINYSFSFCFTSASIAPKFLFFLTIEHILHVVFGNKVNIREQDYNKRFICCICILLPLFT
jgi:hypothetical protein